jgi:hypothetical protein
MLTAALLGLVVALGGVPGVVAPAAAQAAYGWYCAGKYRCYEEARHMRDQLEACGYDTCMKPQGGYYYVYYK